MATAKKKKGAGEVKVCVARIAQGSGSDLPEGAIPASFSKVLDFWNEHKDDEEDAGVKIVEMLKPFIRANFAPENIPALKKILSSMDDIEAFDLAVTGFAWDGSSVLPEISAIAFFKVSFKVPFTQAELEEWESEVDDTLAFCVNFWWEFEDLEAEGWESYLDTNSGVEMWIAEQEAG